LLTKSLAGVSAAQTDTGGDDDAPVEETTTLPKKEIPTETIAHSRSPGMAALQSQHSQRGEMLCVVGKNALIVH
jgi:hypothetical protein